MLNPFSAPFVALAIGLLLVTTGQGASARVLLVGPTRALTAPSAAAAIAQDGDTVRIDPGSYTDCAVWRANHLLVVAAGPGVVLRDRVCQNKGIFVTVGNHITISGLTFAHARAPAHNGAGIRAQGADLTILHCEFLENENGILAAPMPDSTIRIEDSDFRGNGACEGECAHGIYINRVALLEIMHSRFVDQHIGHDVKSRALRTVLTDDTIMDGPDGTSSYLVDLPNGGDFVMRGCDLQKGVHSDNPEVAMTMGEEGVSNPTHQIEISDSRFQNNLDNPTIFLRNLTSTPARLTGNRMTGQVVVLDGPGVVQP
jgi:hypothetical protein